MLTLQKFPEFSLISNFLNLKRFLWYLQFLSNSLIFPCLEKQKMFSLSAWEPCKKWNFHYVSRITGKPTPASTQLKLFITTGSETSTIFFTLLPNEINAIEICNFLAKLRSIKRVQWRCVFSKITKFKKN